MIAASFIFCAAIVLLVIADMAACDGWRGLAFSLFVAGCIGIVALIQVMHLMGVFK